MFGYVKPLPAELLVKEYELYKAIYCGLCRTGGKTVSRFTRFFLSYDFTALAALRLALTNEDVSLKSRRCPYNLKRKQMLDCDEELSYTAAAFSCLGYCKALDDVKDEKGLKRLGKRLALPLFARMKKRAHKRFPDLYGAVSKPLSELDRLEKDGKRHTLDEYAHYGAEAVAVIASGGLEGDAAAIAYEAGYHIGRYIYIIDAVDDLRDDAEKGCFNPLIKHFGTFEAAKDSISNIYNVLYAGAVRFSAAVGLAKDSVYTDILQNIARFGMMKTADQVYDRHGYIKGNTASDI